MTKHGIFMFGSSDRRERNAREEIIDGSRARIGDLGGQAPPHSSAHRRAPALPLLHCNISGSAYLVFDSRSLVPEEGEMIHQKNRAKHGELRFRSKNKTRSTDRVFYVVERLLSHESYEHIYGAQKNGNIQKK